MAYLQNGGTHTLPGGMSFTADTADQSAIQVINGGVLFTTSATIASTASATTSNALLTDGTGAAVLA